VPYSREREDRIRLERIRELFGTRGLYAFAAPAASIVVAAQVMAWVWPVGNRVGTALWLCVVIPAEIGAGLLIWWFHRKPRDDGELARWARRRVAAEIARGVGWSLLALLSVFPGKPMSLLPAMATLIGLCAASSAGLAVYLPALTAFVGSVSAASAAFLLWRSASGAELYAAAMFSTNFLLVMLNGGRMSLLYRNSIELRLDLAEQVEVSGRLQGEAEAGRRIAEEAAVERAQFFGAASHDLRQPVHALGLYAALLRRDPPPTQRRELIRSIAACVDTLERLFNAILGVSQALMSRDDSRVAALPLQDLIDGAALQFHPEAERRGLRLRTRDTPLWVRADATAVQRILANLVANALAYTERGGALVAARRRGDRVELVVADTGMGIAQTDHERVFDPFFQVRPDRPTGRHGFGLGLATVKQLCITHGYDIDLRSRLGFGSVFRVCLPAAEPADPPRDIAPTEPAMRKKLRVLLVEDDALVADAVSKLLATWGVPTELCSDSHRALQILEAGPGRWLAILDYRLHGRETGLDIADAIRRRFADEIPIAIVTGDLDVLEHARQRGLRVLQKPLRPIRLRALLASMSTG